MIIDYQWQRKLDSMFYMTNIVLQGNFLGPVDTNAGRNGIRSNTSTSGRVEK